MFKKLLLLPFLSCWVVAGDDAPSPERHAPGHISYLLNLNVESLEGLALLAHYMDPSIDASDHMVDAPPKISPQERQALSLQNMLSDVNTPAEGESITDTLSKWQSMLGLLGEEDYRTRPIYESPRLRQNWVRALYAETRSSQSLGMPHFNLTQFLDDPLQASWATPYDPDVPNLDPVYLEAIDDIKRTFEAGDQEKFDMFMLKLLESRDAEHPLLLDQIKRNLIGLARGIEDLTPVQRGVIQTKMIDAQDHCSDAVGATYHEIMIDFALFKSATPKETLLSIGLNAWKTLRFCEILGRELLAEAEGMETFLFTLIQLSKPLGLACFINGMKHRSMAKGKFIGDILLPFFGGLNHEDFLHFLSRWPEWTSYFQRTGGDVLPDTSTEAGVEAFTVYAEAKALETLTTLGFLTTSVDYPLPVSLRMGLEL